LKICFQASLINQDSEIIPREKVDMVEKIKVDINPVPTLRVNQPAVIEATRRVLQNLASTDSPSKAFWCTYNNKWGYA